MGKDAELARNGQKFRYWEELNCPWERFYGPGYERGSWPNIKAAIQATGATAYGSDDGAYAMVDITPRLIELLDEHWATYGQGEGGPPLDPGEWPVGWPV